MFKNIFVYIEEQKTDKDNKVQSNANDNKRKTNTHDPLQVAEYKYIYGILGSTFTVLLIKVHPTSKNQFCS